MLYTPDDVAHAIADTASDYYPAFWHNKYALPENALWVDFHDVPRGSWDAALESGWALYVLSKIAHCKTIPSIHTLPEITDIPELVVQHIINGPPTPRLADIWVEHCPLYSDYDRYIMVISVRPNHKFMPAIRRDTTSGESWHIVSLLLPSDRKSAGEWEDYFSSKIQETVHLAKTQRVNLYKLRTVFMYLSSKGTGEDWARYAAALQRLVSNPDGLKESDHIQQLVGWAESELPASALEDTRKRRWKWGDKMREVVEFTHPSGEELLANVYMGKIVAYLQADGTMVDLHAWKKDLGSESESDSEHGVDARC